MDAYDFFSEATQARQIIARGAQEDNFDEFIDGLRRMVESDAHVGLRDRIFFTLLGEDGLKVHDTVYVAAGLHDGVEIERLDYKDGPHKVTVVYFGGVDDSVS